MVDVASIPGVGNFLGGITGSPLLNPVVWVIVIVVLICVIFGGLEIRKRRKLQYPAAEVVNLGGHGKTSINFIGKKGAGWFGKQKTFFGFWDYGEKVMKLRSGEVIYQFSEEDFQEVNGHRGVVFYRDPISRSLVPIGNLKVTNADLLLSIAPAEYTEITIEQIRKNELEMQNTWEKYAGTIVLGLAVIAFIIALVVVNQMQTHSIDKMTELSATGFATCAQVSKQVCSNVCSNAGLPPSKTAP